MTDEKEEKKPPYHYTISLKGHDLETIQKELDRKSNVYETENNVLSREYAMVYGYQIWVVSRTFCCEAKEATTY